MIPKPVVNIIKEITSCMYFLNNREYEKINTLINTGNTAPKRINQKSPFRSGTITASRKANAP
jgi:hypothetical protein